MEALSVSGYGGRTGLTMPAHINLACGEIHQIVIDGTRLVGDDLEIFRRNRFPLIRSLDKLVRILA